MSVLAAIGNLSLDVVDGDPPRPGGAVLYSAATLARLGADACVGAACAARDRGALVAPLEELGLPITWHASSSTASYAFRYDGDRRLMRQDAVGDAWSPADALAAVGAAAWVHVGALVRSDFPEDTLAALAKDGRKLLVDAQGLVRTPDLGELRTNAEIGGALRHVSILKLNDEEAETLAGSSEPEALRALRIPEIVLTLGSEGSCVVTAAAVERIPAEPVAADVDPTGAGDTYAAAYIVARSRGADPVEAARAATEEAAEFLSDART
jgi:sugar/nucleoside kinase (ribokinase family)